MLIALISDTHGLLRPSALRSLHRSDLIIHAGDLGDPAILDALREIAPVVAVRGNVDNDEWAEALPITAVADGGAAQIYVLHDVKQLDVNPATAGFSFVVSGHAHQPGQTERDGVIYINPGSAGPRRFQLPITVARIDLKKRPWKAEFIDVSAT